ncbi:MAG: pyridoxal-phosphate dependent enzyme [Spirochaetaceae bacterium]
MDTLKCVLCKKEYSGDTTHWRCTCGGRFEIPSAGTASGFTKESIERDSYSLWRYGAHIPVPPAYRITLGEGWTPLITRHFSGREVYIKLEHLFPSGSYKDRGAAVLLSKLKHLGIRRVVEDSSGNAGAAVAAYCAAAGIAADIYVPASNSPDKLAQIRSYGARLVPVKGSRGDTAKAALRAAESSYYASHVWNPYFFEGTKTFAYEVWEQLGFRAPDTVVLPAGNGTLLLGSLKGFKELKTSGLITKVPVHVAVQSASCAPLAEEAPSAHSAPAPPLASPPAQKPTIAEGIAIAQPLLLNEMREGLRASGGYAIRVEEDEIVETLGEAVESGLYIEPTAAAALAGLRTYAESADRKETIVGVVTGHGLKASGKIASLLRK